MAEISSSSAAQQGLPNGVTPVLAASPPNRLDADMALVLDTMARLGARPLEHCTPDLARLQPGPAEAVKAILERQQRTLQDDGIIVQDIDIANGDSVLPVRLYRPQGLLSRLNPAVLYCHGGGFVTGNLDSHDASARALARRTGAIIVSLDYRLAPEHKFPAAHDDTWTGWTWLLAHAQDLAIDPRRIGLAGEDAGANLVCNVAMRARDSDQPRPVHLLLIHPIAGIDMSTPSYGETRWTRPVGKPAMRWCFRHLVEGEDELDDGRIDLVQRHDLAGMPPTTLVLAGFDPLRSEGEALAEALERAQVPVSCLTYDGVTQGFFGLGQLVTKALFAQADAAQALSRAFSPNRRN